MNTITLNNRINKVKPNIKSIEVIKQEYLIRVNYPECMDLFNTFESVIKYHNKYSNRKINKLVNETGAILSVSNCTIDFFVTHYNKKIFTWELKVTSIEPDAHRVYHEAALSILEENETLSYIFLNKANYTLTISIEREQ